ncbi:LexA family transcriptional regulator [Ramlibacter sp. WS9]|uniref:LexA family protein n=1 Tax=Ramlibacter sp. WS9 TaxID=1882741 RepID=UPI0011438ED8|nr:translesion error-prone DNA polymerase V autoproteolytic subunit [Ramlibacter sp. WS9]ROZ76553.1 peptidase S24 [Ramlibacter sp. WS9]
MQQGKTQHGGPRPGAGRKPAYGEPTKTVRVPQSLVPVVVGYLEAHKCRPVQRVDVDASKARPIAIKRSVTSVPILGRRVRAGKPTSGDDYQEGTADIGRHLVRDPLATFVVQVTGWSMRDAGIADGDELIVDRSIDAQAGRIVVAEVDGELTVKRLQRAATGWLLQAANPDFHDIVVTDRNELHIWGVVTRLVRKL